MKTRKNLKRPCSAACLYEARQTLKSFMIVFRALLHQVSTAFMRSRGGAEKLTRPR
jgi:hypothetical protein